MMKPTEKQIKAYEKQILTALYLIYHQRGNKSEYMIDMMQRIEQRLMELNK